MSGDKPTPPAASRGPPSRLPVPVRTILWSFRFSRLRVVRRREGPLRLLFQHLHTRLVEMKELEFPDLTAVLHCVHAFLVAKVASLDPGFAGSQGLTRKPQAAAEHSVKDEN